MLIYLSITPKTITFKDLIVEPVHNIIHFILIMQILTLWTLLKYLFYLKSTFWGEEDIFLNSVNLGKHIATLVFCVKAS